MSASKPSAGISEALSACREPFSPGIHGGHYHATGREPQRHGLLRVSPARLGLLATLVLACQAKAHASPLDTVQVHGFLSQALVITDDNNMFGDSSDSGGSWDYTELGINASIRPTENLLLAAQALSRRAGGIDNGSIELDYGIADWQLLSNTERTFGVQLGRFKNPFGFYNQTRDVAFTRPSILLPQSIYFDRTRSLGLSADGLKLYHEERINDGVIHTQLGVGQAQVDDDVEEVLGLDVLPGSFDADTSLVGQVRYEHDGGRMVFALSAASVKADYDSPGAFPGDGKLDFQPWIFSAQYNAEQWSLTAEYALRDVELAGFNAFEDNKNQGESWYVQYRRRFLDDWRWLIRYDSLVNDRDDRNGNDYEREGRGPSYSQYANDWTFGLQWQPHSRVMLAGEYHHVDGTAWLPVQDNPDPRDTERSWDMWLFQLSLRF
ncbi:MULTISPECIES: hypothetical protein [unclassified Halomonas]|uniref:hypothetical protein n=1 Tax=unclassified Halomonas TaxID=2609666 RepID=UPI0021BD2A42|nr:MULTISPECIES: hypothetical protein [unclassified Halomonas]